MKRILMAFALSFALLTSCSDKAAVTSGDMTITFSEQGEIASMTVKSKAITAPFTGMTRIEGGSTTPVSSGKKGDAWEFVKQITSAEGSCRVVERFYPTGSSIRWEVTVTGDGEPWSAPIGSVIKYPASGARIWLPWGGAQIKPEEITDPELKNDLRSMPKAGEPWSDPLIPIPFTDALYYYGAPYVTNENPQIAYCPFSKNVVTIPMVTIIDNEAGYGISVALSLEDPILDLTLSTAADGSVTFDRIYHRISEGTPVSFALDIIAHEADWRSGMKWMAGRYPEYFEPINPELAFELNGTGAYSNHYVEFDVQKMKDMAFATNWQASFDFPYMGMFIPPVDNETAKWRRFGGDNISISWMQEYASRMKNYGFHVLNYLNVTEFGTQVVFPPTAPTTNEPSQWWKNCNDYLWQVLPDAVLYIPEEMNHKSIYPKNRDGGPFYTWEDAVIMDCGVPSYRAFLVEQVKRHIKWIKASDGFCIDRMDWLRMYNQKYDDGMSWYDEKPVRSLNNSWRELMEELSPVVHDAGKVLFVNNHTKRIDLLKHIDGIFDEFTYNEAALNMTAFLTLKKPATGWTWDAGTIKAQGADDFFQKYLYMGVFPMCPFPGNDHSIQPDPVADQAYLDYGPLMKQMKYRKWVLEHNPVTVESGNAKANIFEVPEGYIIPVVYASGDVVDIKVSIAKASKNWKAKVFYPGQKDPETLAVEKSSAGLKLNVPMRRNCSMVVLQSE